MSLAYRSGSFVSAGNASGGNLTLTKPTGTVDGDRVVISVYFEPAGTTITVSGGPWESVTIDNTGAFRLQTFTKIASSEPASYTISNSTAGDQWRSACGVAYSGGSGSGTLIDATGTGTAQGDGVLVGSQTAPSIDPTSTDTMVVFGYGNYSGTDVTSTTGFCTNFRGSIGGCVIADAVNATGAATGTSRPSGGPGTEDYAALHMAIIADIAGAAATSQPIFPARMPAAILAR